MERKCYHGVVFKPKFVIAKYKFWCRYYTVERYKGWKKCKMRIEGIILSSGENKRQILPVFFLYITLYLNINTTLQKWSHNLSGFKLCPSVSCTPVTGSTNCVKPASGLQLIMTHNSKPEKVITSHLQCPDIIRTHITTESQSIEMILDKIANPFNKTSTE